MTMKKASINFSDFDDDEVIDSSPLPKKKDRVPADILTSSPPVAGGTVVSCRPAVPAGGSALPMIPIIDGVFDTIKEISRCIAAVSMAKEQTRQAQAQAHAQITESKEQTKRISIQQTEETKRFAMQCRQELAQKELELRKFTEELDTKLAQRQISHEEYIISLDTIGKIVETLISQSQMYMDRLCADISPETLKALQDSVDRLNCHFVEIAGTIVQLKHG